VHAVDRALDLGRILAEQHRRQRVVDDVTDRLRRAVGEALAPADQPLVGGGAHEDLLARAGRP